jgi:hypothetical protein
MICLGAFDTKINKGPFTEMWTEHPIIYQINESLRDIPDEVFLRTRVRDLPIKELPKRYMDAIVDVEKELIGANLNHLEIDYFIADEWFCPDGSTSVAIPFWLTTKRLTKIEKSIIGKVEGETVKEFKMLLRHEIGHCIEHAFRLSKTKYWQLLFGDPKIPYRTSNYSWIKNTADFVNHLPDGYAQCHPEEDFAETFAVWINPKSDWKNRYKSHKGAYLKLQYVDRVVKEVSRRNPRKKSSRLSEAIRMRKTLSQSYTDRLRDLSLI